MVGPNCSQVVRIELLRISCVVVKVSHHRKLPLFSIIEWATHFGFAMTIERWRKDNSETTPAHKISGGCILQNHSCADKRKQSRFDCKPSLCVYSYQVLNENYDKEQKCASDSMNKVTQIFLDSSILHRETKT